MKQDFELNSPFQPAGDQPEAIASMVDNIGKGIDHQVLLGATGTGKTFSMASPSGQYATGFQKTPATARASDIHR